MATNSEIVARLVEALNEGGAKAVAEFLDPDVVFSEPPEQPGATTFYGRERAIEGFGKWAETWSAQKSVIQKVIDKDETLVVLTMETLVGRDGIAIQQPCGTVVTFKDKRIVRCASYWDQGRALEDAGLPAESNVEIVQSIYAGWERGDYSAGEWQDPAIEFVIADGPTPGSWSGVAGIVEGWGDFLRVWEEFHHGMDECRELDDERVLVYSHFGGRGKSSGVEVGQMTTKGATLFHIRDGKVTRIVQYFDRDRALSDLGLDVE